ncbi:hypothetical protein [Streptomyces sp. NPDC056670]|uniref:hypothetical protein n=1 Tax=Streptomyces sp. NPDC056670 TaxID=3345904 RepID=UPI003687BC99
MSVEFINRYREVQSVYSGSRGNPVATDLALWRSFVRSCEHGYDGSFSEYSYDLQVRGAIEAGLADREISLLDGFSEFKQRVKEIDEHFRKVATIALPVARTGNLAWWHCKVPGIGSETFAEDLLENFSITLKVVR